MSTKMDFLLSASSVAKRINCTQKHVYELIAEGSLQAINISTKGKRPRYKISESSLSRFIESRLVTIS